jgi:tripartite-type tricarboxylate transporter receptor subunit TctC
MKYIIGFLAALVTTAVAPPVQAQSGYPTRPIRLVVPLAPGGPSDILARSMAQQLTESMKQTVFVDNRAGAGGVIGSDNVAKSPADGYNMLLLAVATYTINAGRYARLPYDPVRDLKPVSILAGAPYALVVHPALPVRTLKELIALDKKRPGQLNYSSGGAGTGPHLGTEVLKAATGMTAVHIAYKGAGPAMIDLVAGQVQFQLANMIASVPLVKQGRLRVVAISGSKRSSVWPDVIMVPGATPPAIVARLHQELVRVLQQPDVKARLEGEGAEIFGTSPEQSAAVIRTEIERMGKLIKQLGLQAEGA